MAVKVAINGFGRIGRIAFRQMIDDLDFEIVALNGIKEGEVTEIIETDSELYLATVTAEVDEDATASRKETLISTAQTEYYNSLLETWLAEYEVTVNENVWEQVVFDRSYDPAS